MEVKNYEYKINLILLKDFLTDNKFKIIKKNNYKKVVSAEYYHNSYKIYEVEVLINNNLISIYLYRNYKKVDNSWFDNKFASKFFNLNTIKITINNLIDDILRTEKMNKLMQYITCKIEGHDYSKSFRSEIKKFDIDRSEFLYEASPKLICTRCGFILNPKNDVKIINKSK